MKKTITLGLILSTLISFSANARILTVNNQTGSVAMFTDVPAAISASQVGDTVFVQASNNAYSSITITKRIVLLGQGGLPNYNGSYASIPNINIDSSAGFQVSGTVINGMYCYYGITVSNSNGVIKSVLARNNYLAGSTFYGTGHILVNNVFNGSVTLGTNCLFSNNIYTGYISGATNSIITNNICTNNYYAFSSTNYCSITNNIFFNENASYTTINNGVGNTFSKNLEYLTDLPSGNITGVTSMFQSGSIPSSVFVETGTVVYNMSISTILTSTFKQLSTSPGKNAGTDGKDIGIYGGNYPWPSNKVFNGDPGLPLVQLLQVQNCVIAPGTNLKINFKAISASKK